jgi:7-cyano-7-deazaguanine synthase
MNASRKPAVVLLSGGLDSTTLLALVASQGYAITALTFRYGQRHALELECASRVARAYQVERHVLIDVDLRSPGGSALTSDIPVPKDRGVPEAATDIPVTYVPARNTVFLAYALAWAEVLGTGDIFIGVNAVDYSGYPDCRPEYIAAFERMANLALKAAVEGRIRVRIHTPLIELRKHEIVQLGASLGVDYSMTSSCYDPLPDGLACGRCDACRIRRRAFALAGIADPIRYDVGSKD